MNLPASWSRMAWSEKLYYLVNTHQAKDFKHAGQILSPKKSKPNNAPPKVIRLPYTDN